MPRRSAAEFPPRRGRTSRDKEMQWKDEYAIGVAEIDSQHKTLLELISEFEAAVAGRVHWNTVQPLIARTREFIKFHFAVEESLMQIVNYPGYLDHKAEHQYVVEQIAALEHQVLRQDLKAELVSVLSVWLFNHILESDKPFGNYVQDYFRKARVA